MKGIKTYISMLLLALLLFPMGEKLAHVNEHLDEVHCGIRDKHFCQTEHSCQICDYVFSSSAQPPETHERIVLFSGLRDDFKYPLTFKIKPLTKFNLFLRGPPSLS